MSLFGVDFTFIGGIDEYSESSDDYSSSYSESDRDDFTSADGGTLSIYYNAYSDDYDSSEEYYASGWDPYAGNFSYYPGDYWDSSWSGLSWSGRTSESFSQRDLWVDGQQVTWNSGNITQAGIVTDQWGGGSLVISGHIRDVENAGATADVTWNGTVVGTYTTAGGFDVTGVTIDTQQPIPPTIAPAIANLTDIWVDGAKYTFDQGVGDHDGSLTDHYINASLGTVTFYFADAQVMSAVITGNHGTTAFSGNYDGTNFTITDDIVTFSTSAPPPEAVWVRGQLYVQDDVDPTVFQVGEDGDTLTLTLVGSTATISNGSDAVGPFSGSLSVDAPGVVLLSDGANPTVPAMLANTNGALLLAGEPVPTNHPPAVMVVDGRIWAFLGTAADDIDGTLNTAYYGDAQSAGDEGHLLKIRPDGTAVITDYVDSDEGVAVVASTFGTYSTSTYLFQTSGPDTYFPVPIYGVDPDANHSLWQLEDPEGLPATFLVAGHVWRYTGTSAEGAAIYQGYYTGQQLALGTPDEDGMRLVDVTDPIYGDTTGTLNDVRGSVRLRDDRMAYSGDFDGVRIDPTLNDTYLYTIDGDLDVTGNVLSYGSLAGESAVVGVTLQFVDDGVSAEMHASLGRPLASWVWSRASSSGGFPVASMTFGGSDNLLSLLPPEDGGQGIELNARTGVISASKVRVPPGGDLPMNYTDDGGLGTP